MSVLRRLRQVRILRPLLLARDFIMRRTGLFYVKSCIKRRLSYLRWWLEDNKRRNRIKQQIYKLPTSILHKKKIHTPSLTVSLTSYGKRVKKSAPYAIYSILNQTVLPDRIVLNLDRQRWDDSNIPTLLKKLKRLGVTIEFVDDIGPHTKFIPTLTRYPNDIIITVDDDVYYERNTIEELFSSYINSDKKTVICREGKCILKEDGHFITYSKQPDLSECNDSPYKLPFGVAGVLYPPHLFSDEIFNVDLIKRLCPKADDLWFGVMELREGIRVEYIENNSWTGTSVDRNEEYNPAVSESLYRQNDLDGQNDVQWKALMDYYFGKEI